MMTKRIEIVFRVDIDEHIEDIRELIVDNLVEIVEINNRGWGSRIKRE
jgi:hypothetical protein